MQNTAAPRAPSPCSESTVIDACEDIVSLASTEDDNESELTQRSETSTPGTLRNDRQAKCLHRAGTRCQTNAREERSNHQERDQGERPKAIWTRSRKRAFSHFLLLHFTPIAITLVLFWLYLKGLQWRANDFQLKSLLFAAKLHESLIMISLADILFHRIRYQLLTGRGISFGLLVSPFRLSSPFSLFQTPFFASAKFALKSGPELVTILLVVLVSVLALLAAPSSGVLMLPKYDWWQIPKHEAVMANFTKLDHRTATYIGAPFEDLFPLIVDGHFAPRMDSDDSRDAQTLSSRFEQLISGLDRVLVDGSLRGNANITVVNGATVDAFGLAYQEETLDDCDFMTCQYFAEALNTTVEKVMELHDNPYHNCTNIICQSVAVQSTAPLALVTQQLFDRYRNWMPASSNINMIAARAVDANEVDRTWRQPSISMQCSTAPHDGTHELHFRHLGSFPPFFISPDTELRGLIKRMKPQGGPPAMYTDIGHLIPPGITISTAFLIQGVRETYPVNNATYLCLVDARWIESDVWYSAPYASIMRSGVSLEYVRATTASNATSATNPVINITSEYANSLDANLTVVSNYMNKSTASDLVTPFEFIQRYCHMRVADGLQPKCAMLAHALYLTDSLRRTQSRSGYRTEGNDLHQTSLEKDKWTKLAYRVYHQLHAYEFQGSIIKLSMSVLLVHMMLVYAHLLLLVLGDGWCSRAWSELGELMALAIQTRPSPLLQNTGGGVDKWHTWRLRTFVREVTPEGRLELVLKETGGSPRLLVEPEDGRDRTLVEPEADRRYG